MKDLRILNDTHCGAIRSAGTTVHTQMALRGYLQTRLKELLPVGENLLIQGDLFDTHSIPLVDLGATIETLFGWLKDNADCKLYNMRGNHDAHKSSNIWSSFDLLGRVLSRSFPDRYVHITEPTMTPYGYMIPHLPNQEQFDLALLKVPETAYLFVHCNYNNFFAQQADQSLNMSEEQVANCKAGTVVFAHEHHGRNFGKVLVPGNQIASSVSDWLSPQNKRYLTIRADGSRFFTECGVRATEYAEILWNQPTETEAKFVRLIGNATSAQSSDVVNAVNKYRKSSDAFVVANAVAIESDEGSVNFEASLEAVQGFSVLEALRKFLTPAEMAVLEPLCS